jgi:hypothetical protein
VIDYTQIVVLLLCMSFFVKGARIDEKSPLLWGALSLGAWIVCTQLWVGGIAGGLLSQLGLLAGLAGWELLRERRETKRRGEPR